MKLRTAIAAMAIVVAVWPLASAQTQAQGAPPASKPSTTPAPPEKIKPMWYAHQGNEIHSSKLIGASVMNTVNEAVGDVDEVLLTRDGKIAAVVINVGALLGIGDRVIAVEFSSLRLAQDGNRLVVTIDATKGSLSRAPEWRGGR